MPVPAGLGVHLTLDLAGRARFGPDVEWVETLDYPVDPPRAERLSGKSARTFPALADGTQHRVFGYPPQDAGPRRGCAKDFLIEGTREHGVAGLVNLFGIESPGLTASLAIADHVRDLLR